MIIYSVKLAMLFDRDRFNARYSMLFKISSGNRQKLNSKFHAAKKKARANILSIISMCLSALLTSPYLTIGLCSSECESSSKSFSITFHSSIEEVIFLSFHKFRILTNANKNVNDPKSWINNEVNAKCFWQRTNLMEIWCIFFKIEIQIK